jgi:hypothetical protein
MIDVMLIGPVISDDIMTGHVHQNFLQNGLQEQQEDVPLATRIALYFQYDTTPSHYTRLVMQHLNDTFPNQWIACGSTMRSPDLPPLDFCLWGWTKSDCTEKKWIHETKCSIA